MNQENSLLRIQQKHKQANRNELNGEPLSTGMLLLMLNPPLLHFHLQACSYGSTPLPPSHRSCFHLTYKAHSTAFRDRLTPSCCFYLASHSIKSIFLNKEFKYFQRMYCKSLLITVTLKRVIQNTSAQVFFVFLSLTITSII